MQEAIELTIGFSCYMRMSSAETDTLPAFDAEFRAF